MNKTSRDRFAKALTDAGFTLGVAVPTDDGTAITVRLQCRKKMVAGVTTWHQEGITKDAREALVGAGFNILDDGNPNSFDEIKFRFSEGARWGRLLVKYVQGEPLFLTGSA